MPEKRKYRILCTFTVASSVEVEARSYEEACAAAQEAPLPPKDSWEYLSESFRVDLEDDYQACRDDGHWDSRSPEQNA